MKVVHITQSEGIASSRLHAGLRRLGHDSIIFVGTKHGADPHVVAYRPAAHAHARVRRSLRRRRIAKAFARHSAARPFELFSDDRTVHGGDPVSQLPSADVVNVHSLLGFIDYGAFFRRVTRRYPVVRTLHDWNAFTGGCHQPDDCSRFVDYCGRCPQLGSDAADDLSRAIWERKRAALEAIPPGRLHLVAPSRWLASEVKRSNLLGHVPVTVIPLALDTDVFRPHPQRFAREVLGIDPEAAVILFIGQPLGRVNKGLPLLVEAVKDLHSRRPVVLVIVGDGKPPAPIDVPHLKLGYIGQERLLAFVYSAADVFTVCSRQENFPQASLESIACGTPVVGTAVGGVPEIVRPDVTGLLVPPNDILALRSALERLLNDTRRRAEMAANCRHIAATEYALEVQARSYVSLYEAMVAEAQA